MKMTLVAVALSIAIPSLAHAQKYPVPSPGPSIPVAHKHSCCDKMDAKMVHGGKMGSGAMSSGHDMMPAMPQPVGQQ